MNWIVSFVSCSKRHASAFFLTSSGILPGGRGWRRGYGVTERRDARW
jgi:hypothetical protein